MGPFLMRRFGVWYIPFALVLLTLTFTVEGIGSLLGILFLAAWTILLVTLEKRVKRFRKWMNSSWGS